MTRTPLLAILLLCAATLAAAAPARVLFVGNELLTSTDVPGRLEALARAMGKAVRIETVAFDGFDLSDHWRDGRAGQAIARGWDVVVLQQGASARDGGRELAQVTARFAGPIRAAGARPALCMGWPEAGQPQQFEAEIRAWREAARAIDAALIPAGEAFLRVIAADRRARLYSDARRPAALGSDLVVLSAWFTLFPAGPREFDEAYVARIASILRVPPERRDLVFDAATRAIDEPLPLR